ncbi:MAG: hypothetical protein ACYSU2_07115 [Planctomycetota bacterium]|jgi:hypothetical protein
MKTSGLPRHLITTAAVCAAIASAPIAGAQTTRQAAAGAYALTTDVWTCTAHEQFRMTRKGACPICGKDLVRRKVSLQGPDAVGDPYPLDTCPVSGKELGSMGDPIVMMHEGREVRLCCKGCIKTFETDAARYFKEIDQKIIEQQLPYYPVTTCVVSGEPLGSMGEPVNYVHNNRLMRLCCKGCLRALKNDPTAYLGVLNGAVVAQQGTRYPLATCVISKQKLGSMGEPIDYIVANRLVRFCCAGCTGAFNRAPAAHLATVDKAWKKSGGLKREHANEGKSNEHDEHEEHDHDH